MAFRRGRHAVRILIAPARIDFVDPPDPGVEIGAARFGAGLRHEDVALMDVDHLLADVDGFSHRQRRELDLAGTLQRPILHEGDRQRHAHDDGPVVAQHQYALVAEVLEQACPLFIADGDPFEIVPGDPADEVAGVEIGRQQPGLGRADRHRRGGVGVDDRVRVGKIAVEHRVLDEARAVDGV